MAIKSCICVKDGHPKFLVNGELMVPMAYITYLTERNHYEDFSLCGYELFSVPVFWGGRGINTISHISPFSKGIYDHKGIPDYKIFDQEIERIIDAAPNAYIFPRVNVMMPQWWCEENPLECNDIGIDGEAPRECFFSDKWRRDAGQMLKDFIEHVEKSDFRDHIVGYQIAGGKTEEWFPFDNCGSVGPAAREKIREICGENASEADWCRCLSDVTAQSIDYFAEIAKECTGRRVVIGCFYGYTMEVTDPYSGHHAMEKMLNSPNIDFFCAPSSYQQKRKPGRDWACMTALDSVLLHGKMFFTEYDTRTYLTRPLREARPFGCLPGTYEGGLWEGPSTKYISRQLLKNNAARQLTHGTGSWWFDMWGGWFAEKEIMSDLAMYRCYTAKSLEEAADELNQVAVLVDEKAYALLPRDSKEARECSESRTALGLTGVPYAIYQIGDFAAIKDQYQAYLFLVPVETIDIRNAINYCVKNGKAHLVIDSENMPLTTKVLRKFYAENHIHIWCESDEVVYAGNGWLSVHAASAGKKELRLPDGYYIDGAVYGNGDSAAEEICNKRICQDCNMVSLEMQEFETRIFRLHKVNCVTDKVSELNELMGREEFANERLMIGIDGGGTKTEFVLFSERGEVLNKVRCTQSNPIDVGIDQCCQVLDEGLEMLMDDMVNVQGIFAGIAGTSVSDNAKRIADFLKKKLNIKNVWVDSDAVNVIASRVSGVDGMALICGTGSVLYARENGKLHRVGGWGYLLDESGSGYDLGKDAIRAALAQLDGMGEHTVLTDLLKEELKSELWDSLNEIYSKGRLYIASLAPLVFEAARQGDKVANEIIQKNATHLAMLINTAMKLYQCGNEVVACGGIFDNCGDVLVPIIKRLIPEDVKFIMPQLPPIFGACAECCRMMDIIPEQEFYDTFYNSYIKREGM